MKRAWSVSRSWSPSWSCVALFCVACGASSTEPDSARPQPAGERAATGGEAAASAAEQSLFERLGGLEAIEAVVADFVGRTTTDPRIKHRFFNTDPVHLRKMLVEQVCQATGGPCQYSGRDMKATHGGMELVEEEFDALVEDLVAALDKFEVPEREKGELLGALAGMKGDIVAPADQLRPIPKARLDRAARVAARLKNAEAAELLTMAILAGSRGQRSYAEQLFSRAELLVGPRPLASVASTFRADAPPRVTSRLRTLPMDTPPQPRGAVGSSEEDDPKPRPAPSQLEGALLVDGAPLSGMGVVMLDPVSGRTKRRVPKQRTVEQRGREFAPRLMAVPVGSTVAFPNFDPYYHNVFSLSAAAAFDLGLYASGDTREVTFKKEGIVRLGCNLHSSMAGYIIVVSSQHYAVTDGSGRFAFRRLKPGRYKVKAWSERSAAPLVTEVTIEPGTNRITLPLEGGAPDPNPNKFGVGRL